MKILLGALALLSFSSVAAPQKIKLYCRVPTTVFSIDTLADQTVQSTVSHPYGIRFTPHFKGTVVAEQAVELAEKAQVLSGFGSSQSFIWPAESCRSKGPLVFTCSQGRPVMIAGQEVHPISVVTTLSHHELADFSYDVLNVNLTFRIGAEIFNLTSDFQLSNCQ